MRVLKYVERCTGAAHDGPAWIACVQLSRSRRTVYFHSRALSAARGGSGEGNYFDAGTGELYWVSGVKRSGTNRHRAGSGRIQVERSAVAELLSLLDQRELDASRFRVIEDLPATDPRQFVPVFNERL